MFVVLYTTIDVVMVSKKIGVSFYLFNYFYMVEFWRFSCGTGVLQISLTPIPNCKMNKNFQEINRYCCSTIMQNVKRIPSFSKTIPGVIPFRDSTKRHLPRTDVTMVI